MKESLTFGPQPYNVDLITRKIAKNKLVSQSLPDPCEEVTMS